MISAVVVFHSDLARLATTLASLRRQVAELLVVDVSPAGEARRAAPEGATVLDGVANRGYGWACNLGVAASRGDLVLVSNSDVVYGDDAVAALARVAGPRGLAAPLQTLRRGSRRPEDTYESVQLGISVRASANRWLGLGRRGFVARRRALLADPPAVLALPADMTLGGASLMASKAIWGRVGGFDERYFLYQEDADLSVRARRAGVPVDVATEALVFHESGSARAGFDRRILTWAMTSEREAWRSHGLPVGVLVALQVTGLGVRGARAALAGRPRSALGWWHLARTPQRAA